jgi:hypothetical protein
MNNLAQSNIVQLCAIIVGDLFAVTVSSKIRNSMPLDDWDGFTERAVSFIKTQLFLSLNYPKTKKLKEEWELFAEEHTRRLSKNLVNTFLLGIKDYGEHFHYL